MLITFEGVDGSGKTTQLDLLYGYLINKGYDVVKTREPGGTRFGEALREIFLEPGINISSLSELLVFMAIRAQHIEEVINPSLKEGKIVLCDRFTDASYAYQGGGRGVDFGIIETLNRLVTKGVRPNLTILLDCKAEIAFKRKRSGECSLDRFEQERIDFYKQVRTVYLKLSKEDPKRFFVVNGSGTVEDIHKKIRVRVDRLLNDYGL
ncbi:MAG: dTMP kinase [Syntrophorhabdaceae bacterium]|nr:dTMP kinase [Syntrophorhabdaceae bacterium]